MKKIIKILIRLYQLTLSPIFTSLGGGCRFHPTCSDYSKTAFEKHGLFKALKMTIWRILRCNPFNPGGLDPVK